MFYPNSLGYIRSKKVPQENLQEFLQFKRRGSKAPDKKKYQRRDKHHKEDVQW